MCFSQNDESNSDLSMIYIKSEDKRTPSLNIPNSETLSVPISVSPVKTSYVLIDINTSLLTIFVDRANKFDTSIQEFNTIQKEHESLQNSSEFYKNVT